MFVKYPVRSTFETLLRSLANVKVPKITPKFIGFKGDHGVHKWMPVLSFPPSFRIFEGTIFKNHKKLSFLKNVAQFFEVEDGINHGVNLWIP